MGFLEQVPLYYFVISIVVCGAIAWIYARALAQRLDVRFIMDLSIVVLITGFIGARLFHVVYEHPIVYRDHPSLIFDFGRGGYVYYGGFLVGILSGWIFMLVRRTPDLWKYFDFFAPVASIGYAFGRVACLLAGCCYGPETNGWGMKVRDEYGTLHYHQPVPLYPSIIELVIFSFIMALEKNSKLKSKLGLNFKGSIFLTWVLLHATARFFLEFLRADYRGPQYIFSVSAWISLILFLVSASLLWKRRSSAR